MRSLEKRLLKYENEVKIFLEEADFENPAQLITDFDDLIMFRYGLPGKIVEELDRKYLPKIYEAITSRYPEFKTYVLNSFKSAGVDLSLFQKIPA
ncbi:hypothetical protein [Thermovibrio ammonificans]|uniref:hypothetical protein n=1 Tax=Thermovibrio ammonificans TaxID=228745 RepID=UPI0012FB4954|nr:hypothetical protein [Thermovibrio ammonificans]